MKRIVEFWRRWFLSPWEEDRSRERLLNFPKLGGVAVRVSGREKRREKRLMRGMPILQRLEGSLPVGRGGNLGARLGVPTRNC